MLSATFDTCAVACVQIYTSTIAFLSPPRAERYSIQREARRPYSKCVPLPHETTPCIEPSAHLPGQAIAICRGAVFPRAPAWD